MNIDSIHFKGRSCFKKGDLYSIVPVVLGVIGFGLYYRFQWFFLATVHIVYNPHKFVYFRKELKCQVWLG